MPPSLHKEQAFQLDSGHTLYEVKVAYQTWGRLNAKRDNALVVCHALTGDTDVTSWWRPLLGPERALDTNRYFVICMNVLGSCYGTTGPASINPKTDQRYQADFPLVTVRDTVRLHKRLLDRLGIKYVVAVIGGSMGGMQVLEWAFYGDFVQMIIPIAVGGRHSAWCIGISETQRQAIYTDPKWNGGFYDPNEPPAQGLATARMIAIMSYRSRHIVEIRHGRDSMPNNPAQFDVVSYLHHQGHKLTKRFDANSYVRLTQLMDTHDVARGRGDYETVLQSIQQPALVIGIDSDVLYPLVEQEELAHHLPHAQFHILYAPYGHDTFLIELDTLNTVLTNGLADLAIREEMWKYGNMEIWNNQ